MDDKYCWNLGNLDLSGLLWAISATQLWGDVGVFGGIVESVDEIWNLGPKR
jgi:hypothetical protein